MNSVWTDCKPDKAGNWWWRADAHHGNYCTVLVMDVYPCGNRWLCRSVDTSAAFIDEIGGQWSSTRIEEPVEEMHLEGNIHLDLQGGPTGC